MKVEIIKAIFTNCLFVLGVLLIVFGFIQGTLTAVRTLTFEEYPLASYEETRCDLEYLDIKTPRVMVTPSGEETVVEESTSAEEIERRQAKCKATLAHARQVKQTEHIVTSITTLVAGSVLVFSFRRFIFG